MGVYFSAIWRCRYFWLSLVKMDLRTRYRGSVLGIGWSLLQPLAMTAIFCVVFTQIFPTPIKEYAPMLMVGLACWNFVLNVTLQGCACFYLAEPYIRQYPAPLAIYPLRTALGVGFHFLVALLLGMLLSWGLNGIHHPVVLLALVPAVVLLVLFGWSLSVLAGLATVHFPDTKHLSEVAFQMVFYVTPIIYPPSLVSGRLGQVMSCNPLSFFLDLFRVPIVQGQLPPLHSYVGACLTVMVAAGGAAYALRSLERRFIFHL
jgi:ABC-type polysaccharide/polyol phosphate export permease